LDGGRLGARHLGLLGGDALEHEGLVFNLLATPGHQDFSPLGFQPTGVSALGFQQARVSVSAER